MVFSDASELFVLIVNARLLAVGIPSCLFPFRVFLRTIL